MFAWSHLRAAFCVVSRRGADDYECMWLSAESDLEKRQSLYSSFDYNLVEKVYLCK